MFGNKKVTVTFEGLPVILAKRESVNRFTGETLQQFLAYKSCDKWHGLVGYEQFREELDEVNKKIELILSHLDLRYVPEHTHTAKTPAKLEKRFDTSVRSTLDMLAAGGSTSYVDGPATTKKKPVTKKKKRL